MVYDQSSLTSTSQQVNGLSEGTTYYWRVNATNSAGTSGWSDTWHFTTKIMTTITQPVTVKGSSQNAYRIISIPVDADNKTPARIFSNFGPYDDTKWRLFELRSDQKYYEYSNISEIVPGRGYWLISNMSGKVMNTGAGKTIRTDQPYSIPLYPGWTLIGNPFIFSVPLSNLTLENGAELNMLTYTGDWAEYTGSLQPFQGYLVGSESATNLLVDPGMVSSKILKAISRRNEPLWEVSIHAQCQEARDTYTVFGVQEGASIDLDEFDRAEPPVIGEYVSVYFPHEEWNSVFSKFGKDFHPENTNGYVWEFTVQTNIHDKVQLTFPDIDKIPGHYDIWLCDEIVKHAQNLHETNQYEIACGHSTRSLKLIVGERSFVDSELNKLDLIPQIYVFEQNYPNPFNPVTTIRFGIPSEQEVTVKIYNILGQEVIALLNKVNKPAGYHTVIWNGINQSGQFLSSGIYLYSLETKSYKAVKKMILIK